MHLRRGSGMSCSSGWRASFAIPRLRVPPPPPRAPAVVGASCALADRSVSHPERETTSEGPQVVAAMCGSLLEKVRNSGASQGLLQCGIARVGVSWRALRAGYHSRGTAMPWLTCEVQVSTLAAGPSPTVVGRWPGIAPVSLGRPRVWASWQSAVGTTHPRRAGRQWSPRM